MYAKTVDLAELLLWNGGSAGNIPVWNGSAFVPSVLTYVDAAQDELVVNEAGADVDYRVEGVGQANALFVRGSDGSVGVGTSNFTDPITGVDKFAALDGTTRLSFRDNSSGQGYLVLSNGTILAYWHLNATEGVVFGSVSNHEISFRLNGTSRATFDTTGLLHLKGSTGSDQLRMGNAVHYYKMGRNPTTGALDFQGTQVGVIGYNFLSLSALTDALQQLAALRHNSSGTPAAGFGSTLALQLESSTTEGRDAAAIDWLWQTATDASRSADLVLSAYDTAKREGIRVRGAGTAAAIGFLGATPIARQATIADADGTLADVTSKFNTLLSYLENFGLIATS